MAKYKKHENIKIIVKFITDFLREKVRPAELEDDEFGRLVMRCNLNRQNAYIYLKDAGGLEFEYFIKTPNALKKLDKYFLENSHADFDFDVDTCKIKIRIEDK